MSQIASHVDEQRRETALISGNLLESRVEIDEHPMRVVATRMRYNALIQQMQIERKEKALKCEGLHEFCFRGGFVSTALCFREVTMPLESMLTQA